MVNCSEDKSTNKLCSNFECMPFEFSIYCRRFDGKRTNDFFFHFCYDRPLLCTGTWANIYNRWFTIALLSLYSIERCHDFDVIPCINGKQKPICRNFRFSLILWSLRNRNNKICWKKMYSIVCPSTNLPSFFLADKLKAQITWQTYF